MEKHDLELIRRAKTGDRGAFEQLVRNYQDFVYRTAYGMVHQEADAYDIAQDAFVKVFLSLKSLQEERTFPSWLARITVRTGLDWLAKHRRTTPTDIESLQLSGPNVYGAADAKIDLSRALAELSDEHRTVLTLRELHGFDYDELSRILDIPIGTVRSRLHHARQHLRQVLVNPKGGKHDGM